MTQVEHSAQGYPEVNAECRALIVRDASSANEARETPRRSAAFLTQLLAVKEGLPQTREKRRAEPDVAAHLYEIGMARTPLRQGEFVKRAL